MVSSSSPRADWQALTALTRREWGLLFAAAVLLPATRAALHFFGYRRVERVFRSVFRLRASCADHADQAVRTARMVAIASRRSPFAANCLPRSLVLWGLLRVQGVDTALRLGFRREDGQFGAHAWVEHLGFPLNEMSEVGELFETVDFPPE